MTRQAAFRLRQRARGQCVNGQGHGPVVGKDRCLACLVTARVQKRVRCAHDPWRRGSPGRPPVEAPA